MIDYKEVFRQFPYHTLIFEPLPPYRILAAPDSYFEVMKRPKAEVIGKTLEAAFPTGVNEWNIEALTELIHSFEDVMKFKKKCKMAIVRYDTPLPDGEGTDISYWSCDNYPIFGTGKEAKEVRYILHTANNITPLMNSIR